MLMGQVFMKFFHYRHFSLKKFFCGNQDNVEETED